MTLAAERRLVRAAIAWQRAVEVQRAAFRRLRDLRGGARAIALASLEYAKAVRAEEARRSALYRATIRAAPASMD